MWIGGKGMEGAVFEQGLIHLIPRGWIRGIPGQAGSGCKLRLRDVHFGQKAWQEPWKVSECTRPGWRHLGKVHPGRDEVAVVLTGEAGRDS